jgi:hypothetical protein
MTDKAILKTVLREMRMIGMGWRYNWSYFDGRTLEEQLNRIIDWAQSNPETEYFYGSDFYDHQIERG